MPPRSAQLGPARAHPAGGYRPLGMREKEPPHHSALRSAHDGRTPSSTPVPSLKDRYPSTTHSTQLAAPVCRQLSQGPQAGTGNKIVQPTKKHRKLTRPFAVPPAHIIVTVAHPTLCNMETSDMEKHSIAGPLHTTTVPPRTASCKKEKVEERCECDPENKKQSPNDNTTKKTPASPTSPATIVSSVYV